MSEVIAFIEKTDTVNTLKEKYPGKHLRAVPTKIDDLVPRVLSFNEWQQKLRGDAYRNRRGW